MLSWCLYPKVVEEYCRHRKEYGYMSRMGSHVFFNGMALGETNQINIEEGKTLVVKYLGLGDRNEDGTRRQKPRRSRCVWPIRRTRRRSVHRCRAWYRAYWSRRATWSSRIRCC